MLGPDIGNAAASPSPNKVHDEGESAEAGVSALQCPRFASFGTDTARAVYERILAIEVREPIFLSACYAIYGTELAYRATRTTESFYKKSTPLAAYLHPMQSP
eukprot:3941346-Rhodomonas_salina.1